MHKNVVTKATQARPYLKPLPYGVIGDDNPSKHSGFWPWGTYDFMSTRSPSVVGASNKALDKMTAETGQAADLLVAFMERQKSLEMVGDGLMKLVRIARAIRRKDRKLMRKVIYGKSKAEAKMILSRPANIWLAYHFGIVPTISDIHHASGVLLKDPPILQVQSSSRDHFDESHNRNNWSWHYDVSMVSRVKLQGEVTHVNRNKMLLGQLGLYNPLSAIYEMTPFSWFVDYFVNLGDILSNLEPRFPGVTFQNQFTTVYTTLEAWSFYYEYTGNPRDETVTIQQAKDRGQNYFQGTAYCVKRSLGWPKKQLEFNGVGSLSGQRVSYIAAVLVSLLTGFQAKGSRI